ncbi:L,D-transpeptidase family protein [Agrobacterium vitis]|uniref:L,D-transpeptidase n=1 Tax=Agrobacterium vitis TaxID=373 RepID=UPI000871DB56|nr:L,D-transpeptidase [Agrobacterium vitis]MVA53304.1 L,D-transpeptidase family protein [Agrobacterium vitis]
MTSPVFSRRAFLSFSGLGAAALLSSCASSYRPPVYEQGSLGGMVQPTGPMAPSTPELDAMYGEVVDGGFVIPAIPYQQIPPRYYRQRVSDPTGYPAGSIVVDTPNRFLYLVEQGGTAMRYGVGIGREGFAWQGEGVIQWRQKWPKWTPPDEMVARQPQLAKYSSANGGMAPGLMNPLGARALYIFQNGQDTLYRLHGSPEWNSIGKAMSSGCVRLMNQDIIDLYDRVPNKARIIVLQ